MEAQQTQIQDGGKSVAATSSYLCRQSTTRWTPTTDQIKILKDLYYDKGIRSPSADQIQSISATLRKFGKIEGKNVFYWFQNHKARERQKKRFTSTNALHINTSTNYTDQQQQHLIPMQRVSNVRYPNLISPGISCPPPPSAGMMSVGQMVGGCGYGHMSMESNIREYGNGGICAYPSQSFQWSGVNHYPQSYSFMESSRNPSIDYQVQFLDEEQEKSPELETLPLFPIHADQDSSVSSFYGTMMRPEPENCYTTSCHWFNGGLDTVPTNLASLELSLNLNSYGDQFENY